MKTCKERNWNERLASIRFSKEVEINQAEFRMEDEITDELEILIRQSNRLQLLQERGYIDNRAFYMKDGKIVDCPSNKAKMSISELAMFRFSNGGISTWLRALAFSAFTMGSDMTIVFAGIFLAITSPIWIIPHLFYRRRKFRKQMYVLAKSEY